MTRTTPPRRRRGFTLVEVLTVFVIIAILAAILLPAITGAVNTAKDAAVAAEINQLVQALTTFKNQYGDYPPSRVILNENCYYDTTNTSDLSSISWYPPSSIGVAQYAGLSPSRDITYGQLAARSLQYLRKFFPRAQCQQTGGSSPTPLLSAFQGSNGMAMTGTTPNIYADFNGNGVCDQSPILLQGPECLAFFLGGIPATVSSTADTTGGLSLSGFSKSPVIPFQNNAVVTARTTPLFEFKGDRLLDDDLDGIPGYTDSLGSISAGTATYYAYFNSYGQTATTGGYDPNDNNFPDQAGLHTAFQTTFPTGVTGGQVSNTVSPAPNPYTSSLSFPGSTPAIFLNPQTVQIISAGRDHLFGFGGQYLANSPGVRLPFASALMSGDDAADQDMTTTTHTAQTSLTNRDHEKDNLSNFTGGKLD